MKITDLTNKSLISLDLKSTTKETVIEELSELLYKNQKIDNLTKFISEIHKRETQGSTGVESGIAFPHAQTTLIKEPTLAFGLSKKGIDYGSIDQKASHLFFMIAVPEDKANLHLEILATLSRGLMNDNVRNDLRNVKTKKQLLYLLNKFDSEDKE
ncbi:MAG: fructose PTS transporter subunit IIA [Candidatus Izimaplasma sp.]|nr:fructose PTS transporter subunit IIA [Candidatus Izimaplasma bacterium]